MRPVALRAFGPVDPSGAMADECWRGYRRKLARWRERRGGAAELDPAHLDDAARLLEEPAVLRGALHASGAPARMSQLDPPVDAATARWALANCHLMRDRFTIVDLASLPGAWSRRVGIHDRRRHLRGAVRRPGHSRPGEGRARGRQPRWAQDG